MCECIAVVNEKLKTRNTRLDVPIILRFKDDPPAVDRLLIQTTQIETGRGKAKAVSMFASYCPFCGEAYSDEKAS